MRTLEAWLGVLGLAALACGGQSHADEHAGAGNHGLERSHCHQRRSRHEQQLGR